MELTPPPVRYTKVGDVQLAYQVVGDGPRDLVFQLGFPRTWSCNGTIQLSHASFSDSPRSPG